jgi:hypothetical protein
MKMFFALAAVLSTVASTNAAMATSYTGHWPYTVTGSRGSNGNFCLVVTDDGSFGWPHSGFGTSSVNGSSFATFQVIGNNFEVVIQDQGLEVEGTVITASARNGSVGNGVFSTVLTGESEDSGKVAFGVKGGC